MREGGAEAVVAIGLRAPIPYITPGSPAPSGTSPPEWVLSRSS